MCCGTYVLMLYYTCNYNYTKKRSITMRELVRKFIQLNGKIATIILEHCLFDSQRFESQEIQVFEDSERLGLILKGQDVFVYKQRLQSMELHDRLVEFADDKLRILIKF